MEVEESWEGGGVGAALPFPGGVVLNVMMEHRQGQRADFQNATAATL